MDKKSIIGLVLICLVFLVFGWLNRPSEEELTKQKRYNDSIAAAQKKQHKQNTSTNTTDKENERAELVKMMAESETNDSIKAEVTKKINDKFSSFSNSAFKDEKHLILENDVFKIDLTNKGGQVSQVTLKDYKSYNKKPVTFFTDKGNSYGMNLSAGNVIISTQDLYFVPFVNGKIYNEEQELKVGGKDSLIVSMRLYPNKPDTINISEEDYFKSSKAYIEYRYILRGNDYRLGYNIVLNNMQDVITDDSQIEMNWTSDLQLKEKDVDIERKMKRDVAKRVLKLI